MTIRLTITADHIARGKRHIPSADPVALAALAAGYKSPDIGCQAGTLVKDGKRVKVDFPPALREFIKAFDHGETVKPQTFEWEAK